MQRLMISVLLKLLILKLKNGKITGEMVYLNALEEENTTSLMPQLLMMIMVKSQ